MCMCVSVCIYKKGINSLSTSVYIHISLQYMYTYHYLQYLQLRTQI